MQHEQNTDRPSVYEFYNYRDYLDSYFQHAKKKNPSFSASAFSLKAGLKQSSRGYFGLVIKGKRNLSSKTILGFSRAMKLNKAEYNYFETLVNFNQSTSETDRDFYFDKLKKIGKAKASEVISVLESHHNIFKNWYTLAIRELVATAHFRDDSKWISRRLKNKITVAQAKIAMDDLLKIGFIKKVNNTYVQSEPMMEFIDSKANIDKVENFHKEMINRSLDALNEDEYDDRSTSCLLLGSKEEDFPEIRKKINQFRNDLLAEFGSRKKSESDEVLAMTIQLIKLSDKGCK